MQITDWSVRTMKTLSGIVGQTAIQPTPAKTPLSRGVHIKAARENWGTIYFGFSNAVTNHGDATASDGSPLEFGETVDVELGDLSDLWLIGSEPNQVYYLLYR